MSDSDLCKTSAVQLAQEIARGTRSALEVCEAVLARIDQLDPQLHAFCTVAHEQALASAREVDQARQRGEEVGALAGIPIGIKDLVSTKGLRTVGGSPAYADYVPDEDDIVVERLRQAGAVILGKTSVPEFGYSGVGDNPVFPAACNPWDLALTPGGSSSGSGAAVAAGMGPLAIASDGGGSIRVPAAHCGLVGIKASMGRVPLYPGTRDPRFPGLSSWETLEHIGPLARNVADAALMLSVIGSGPDPRDRHSLPAPEFDWQAIIREPDIRGLRVAFSADFGYAAVDPEVRRLTEQASAVFERELGCEVVEAHPPLEDAFDTFWAVVAADSDLAGMRALAEQHRDTMSPHLLEFLDTPWRAEDLTNAQMARKAMQRNVATFMADYDLLLSPTVAVPPFELHRQGPSEIDGREVEPFAWLAFTYPFNMTGQPAASVPAGLTQQGLPVGLQLVGRHLDDATVLKAAAAFEQAQPWQHLWPAMA